MWKVDQESGSSGFPGRGHGTGETGQEVEGLTVQCIFFFFSFLAHEIPRPGVESEWELT